MSKIKPVVNTTWQYLVFLSNSRYCSISNSGMLHFVTILLFTWLHMCVEVKYIELPRHVNNQGW